MIGGMTRALLGVGALRAAAFVIFGAVVFLTREEDRVAVDNLLAENLTRAIQLSEEEADGEVDLRRVADFPSGPRAGRRPRHGAVDRVSEELGSDYKGDLADFGSLGQVFVFARGDELARIADYRGRGTFTASAARSTCSRATTPCSGSSRSGGIPGDMRRLWTSTCRSRSPRRRRATGSRPRRSGCSRCGCSSAGKLGDGELGPPCASCSRAGTRPARAGAIRRLVAPLDPRHVRVATFAAPTHDEKRHHFLWRFWPPLPGWGGMAVLDRSWYGRVLVERVEGFATEERVARAYDEIVEFERMLAREGMVL